MSIKRTKLDKDEQYRMVFKNIRKVWRNPEISRAAKCLLFDLVFYAGIDGEVFPSQGLLANNLGVTPRYVRTLLTELKRHNLVAWVRRGYSTSNKYTLSEALYCRNDKRDKSMDGDINSSMEGEIVPNHSGSNVPAKQSQDKRKKNKELHPHINMRELRSHHQGILETFVFVCKHKCDLGILTNPTSGEAYFCSCGKGIYLKRQSKHFGHGKEQS